MRASIVTLSAMLAASAAFGAGTGDPYTPYSMQGSTTIDMENITPLPSAQYASNTTTPAPSIAGTAAVVSNPISPAYTGSSAAPALAATTAVSARTDSTPAYVHPLAEMQVKSDYYYSPSSSVEGGAGYGIDTTFYSPTFYQNWRLIAGEYFAHENEPEGEGNISLWRTKAGFEYQDASNTFTLTPTYNSYNDDSHGGGEATAARTFNANWWANADAQLFSVNTPMRALNEGIRANEYSANVMWHQEDARSLTLTGDAMTYSDENVRGTATALYDEQLFKSKSGTIMLDGIVSLTGAQASLDINRPYYNPKEDALGAAGLKLTQILYRDGDAVYLQSLQVLPGDYWEKDYGGDGTVDARYEVRAHLSNNFDLGVGGDYSRQAFYGVLQNSASVLLDLTARL